MSTKSTDSAKGASIVTPLGAPPAIIEVALAKSTVGGRSNLPRFTAPSKVSSLSSSVAVSITPPVETVEKSIEVIVTAPEFILTLPT